MKNELKGGLQPTPEDSRDFQLGALITLSKLEELPEQFCLDTLSLKEQYDSDYCAGFSFALLSEMQEGVELSPEFQFMLGKQIAGNIEDWGLDLRSILKSGTKYGSLAQQDAPYTLKDKSSEELRHFENWPAGLIAKASVHKKKSFWKVTGPYDHFDNIRASIWYFRHEKRGVLSGLIWTWALEQFLLTGTVSNGFGHAVPYLGWNKDGIVCQNSAGQRAGLLGRHLVSRETINHFVEKYGAYMPIDLSPEEARHYLDNGIKLDDNWLTGIIKALASFFLRIFKRT